MCYLSGGVQVGSRGGVIVAYHEDIHAMRMFKGPSVQNYLRQQCALLYFQFREHLRDTGGRKDLVFDFCFFLELDQLFLDLAIRSFSYLVYL